MSLSLLSSGPFLTAHGRSGGVTLMSGNTRITLDNTLDERLRLLEDRVRRLHLSVQV